MTKRVRSIFNPLSWIAALALLGLFVSLPRTAVAVDANTCGYVQSFGGWYKSSDRSGPYAVDGNCNAFFLGAGGGLSQPIFTATAPVNRTLTTCVLPAYGTGGNVVCTDQAGVVTTNACAVNTACLVSPANTGRRTVAFQNKTVGTTVSIGYASSVTPTTGIATDGPSTTGAGSPTLTETPASASAYYAAAATAGTTVIIATGL